MTHDSDELALTAYALGEMDGAECAAERSAVEACLSGDEAARRHVEEIRATARLVAAGLGAEAADESAVELTALQHAALERRLLRASPAGVAADSFPLRPRRMNWAMWGSLAASILIVCTVMAGVLPMIYRPGGHGTGPTSPPTGGPFVVDPPPIPTPATAPGPDSGGNDVKAFAEDAAWPDFVAAGVPGAAPPAARHGENGFLRVIDYPLSTLPAAPARRDDAGATYAALRRRLANNQLPPPETVRTDEIINALSYHYGAPRPGESLAAAVEVAACPWEPSHRLARVGLTNDARPPLPGATTTPAIAAPAEAAREVRIQVEFNPAVAGAYRLIGYENRPPAPASFSPATLARPGPTATPIPGGWTLTALYEIIPAALPAAPESQPADALKYQKLIPVAGAGDELLTVKAWCRDRAAAGADSGSPARPARLIEFPATDDGRPFAAASEDFRAAAAAAAFGLVLRDSPYKGVATCNLVIDALSHANAEASPDRSGLLDLAKKAESLAPSPRTIPPGAATENGKTDSPQGHGGHGVEGNPNDQMPK